MVHVRGTVTPRSNRATVSQFALYVSLSLCPLQFSAALTNFVMPNINCLHTFFNYIFYFVLIRPDLLYAFFYNFFKEICSFLSYDFYDSHVENLLVLFKGKFAFLFLIDLTLIVYSLN